MMGGQKNTGFVWTPTKRRGPIAAEFSTPGPAAISLNSTFSGSAPVKSRAPAFTISSRHDSKANSPSPGPGQYNIHGLSCKGKDEPSAPSMHIRTRDPKAFVTPAPGDYCPEKSKKVLDPSPRFSFGVKTENGPPLDIPGPGAYNEAIVDRYKTSKSPAFSMGQRTNIPSDHTMKPGPGAHSPEKCMQDKGPRFTMAGRPTVTHRSDVPGPASYNTPNPDVYLEKSPQYTLAPRMELVKDKSPKPSSNMYKPEKYRPDESPKWTMAPRLPEVEKSNAPGPGTYQVADLNAYLDKQPIYSMRPKTELPTDNSPKPSPNSYKPEQCMKSRSKFTMAPRPREREKWNVPGPGSYKVVKLDVYLVRSPKYTLAPRTRIPTDKGLKPGPNAYRREKCIPDNGPMWSMATRLKELGKLNVPGPGAYETADLDAFLDKQPVYSMRPKTDLPIDKGPRPAPNAYSPEKYLQDDGPKWSMASKLEELGKLNVPGPGSYEATDLNSFLDKQPIFSMRPRTELPTDKGPKPSPNAYNPDKYHPDDGPKWTMAKKTELPHDKTPKPSPNAYSPEDGVMNLRNPEFSFGIKHSPYIGQLRDQ